MIRAIYTAIAAVIHPKDEDEFRKMLEADGIRPNDLIKNDWKFVRSSFQQNEQLLLLGAYLLIYLHLRGCDLKNDVLSASVIKGLSIPKSFTEYIEYYIPYLPINPDPNISCLYTILNPPDELAQWAEAVVYNTYKILRTSERTRITNLNSNEYEHPLDRKMLAALKDTAGFDILAHKFHEFGIEPTLRIRCAGSNIKVTEKNFPELNQMLRNACTILGVDKIPDLYIQQGFINAMTNGVENPFIVIHAGCVALLTEDEMMFLLGHELGHIKSHHLLYHSMCNVLPMVGDAIDSATFGVGGLLISGVRAALMNWQRMSEFTADRAGLLCCQNINASYTLLMKIAGAPPKYYNQLRVEDFIEQAREFSDLDMLAKNKVAKFISILTTDHPWTVMRGGELSKWVEAGGYERVMNRELPIPDYIPDNIPESNPTKINKIMDVAFGVTSKAAVAATKEKAKDIAAEARDLTALFFKGLSDPQKK
jgi:Zn-dependent protease with chaperone function